MTKSHRKQGGSAATLLAAALLGVAAGAGAAPRDTLERLEREQSADPGAWYALATTAREAGELDIARDALARAADAGLSPLAAGLERARILVTAGDHAAAVLELEALAEGGFTGVRALSGDGVLSTLAGNAAFDELVAAMRERAYPCAQDERFRAFDFWVGDWDVYRPDGTLAGQNRIEVAEQGCVLLEHWTSVHGGTGRSVNYLDGASGEWVQVWNASSGTQIEIRGGMTGEGMRLTGEIHYLSDGRTAPFRGLWTPLPDGRVRQYFEQSNDGGATWTPWFEGFYTPRRSSDADED